MNISFSTFILNLSISGESDIQGMELESTPTDDLLSTPLRDYKLSRSIRTNDTAESDRKSSADFFTSEKKHQPPNSLWLEACSTSAPLPGAEMEKEGIEYVDGMAYICI
jgi:hypothetical protein